MKSTKTSIDVPLEPICSSSEKLQHDGNCVSACGNECIAADCLVSGNGLPLCRHIIESGTNPPKTFTDKDCDIKGYELKDGICSPTCPLECQGGAQCKFDFLGNHICACKKGYKMIDDECQLFCGKNCPENEKCAYDFMGREICAPLPTTATPTITEKNCPPKYRLVDEECKLFCGLTCSENEKCAYDWKGDEICRQLPTTETPTTTEKTCPSNYKLVDGECKLFCGLSCSENEKCAYDWSGKEICKKLEKLTPSAPKCDLDCGAPLGRCVFDFFGKSTCKCSEGAEYQEDIQTCLIVLPSPCSKECEVNEECQFDLIGQQQCVCKPGYKIIDDKCNLFCGLECATGERCRYDWSGKVTE